MNRLLLIDGNAVLHRAYHAIPPLTAPDGSVVNAVYGFAAMLIRLQHDLNPQYIAVAFDRPAPTFRKKLYVEYQAKRPKMEDALVAQIDKVHDLVAAFGIPIFEKDGFEADDVIGTICKLVASDKKLETRKTKNQSPVSSVQDYIDQIIIVTGDRDILQLVSDDRVLVYMPTKGLSEAKLYYEKDVVERLGVTPEKIVDYKGFAGDASDNYPGVEGIGPKTTIDLINRFGSVEGVYAYIKKYSLNHELGIPSKLRASMNHEKAENQISSTILKKLIDGENNATLSKKLATIKTDVKLKGKITQVVTLNTAPARKILETLHFHSLLKRLEGRDGASDKRQATSDKKLEAGDKEKQEEKGEQQQLF